MSPCPLDILILGGTGFTGPEQVEYALARGHRVTLLNRNKSRPDFLKGKVEQLLGDLNDDVSPLKGNGLTLSSTTPRRSRRACAMRRNSARRMEDEENLARQRS